MDMQTMLAQGQSGQEPDRDAKMLEIMTKMRAMMDEMISTMSGGQEQATQRGFESVDEGMG